MKRLIVCCDGTWLDSQSGLMEGKLPIPSNVTRISQAIRSVTDDGISQVVYYQAGIGSQGGFFTRVIGGATAEGLAENIRAGYSFLCNNYHDGDEIFFFGFSRGAFTVRSIAGMIDGVGLLTKEGLPYLAQVFKDWENSRNPFYRPRNPNIPFPDKPSASDPKYKRLLLKYHYSRLDVPIKVVGVWDTVGSLGIPRVPWLDVFHLQTKSVREYLFYDTKLNDHILNAFQALALDEHRASFSPAVWEKPKGNTTNLRQVWFPGAHSNVGGGYPDQGIGNLTLAWMMSQVENFLEFEPDYLLEQYDQNVEHYRLKDEKTRPWSFEKIYQSFTGIYVLGGRTVRTPGAYRVVDPSTLRETTEFLRETMEYVHPCVRVRKVKHGPGVEDRGIYDAHPLDPYKLRKPNSDSRLFSWEPRADTDGITLYESPLWGYERELIREDPKMAAYVLEGGRRGRENSGVRRDQQLVRVSKTRHSSTPAKSKGDSWYS